MFRVRVACGVTLGDLLDMLLLQALQATDSQVSVRYRTESFDTSTHRTFDMYISCRTCFSQHPLLVYPCFCFGSERSMCHISKSRHRTCFSLSLLYRTPLSFGIQHNLVKGVSVPSSVHLQSLGSSRSRAEGLAPPLLVDCHHRTFPPNTYIYSECWFENWPDKTPTTSTRVLTLSTVAVLTAIYNQRYV